jgi:uncharacterized protein YbaP (TraB family)
MPPFIPRLSLLLLGIGLLQGCKAQREPVLLTNPDNNTLLWEISGKHMAKPSYLFGSFHIMCKEDIHFSNTLKKAIDRSEEMYFEMDLDDPSNTLGALFFMNMKKGVSLQDLYNPEEYSRLSGFFNDSLKTPIALIGRMKPAFLEALLYPKLMPCEKMSGVEEELMRLARDSKKEIKGFETIAFQASVFDSIPYEVQAKSLLRSIDSLAEYRAYFNNMLQVYKSQQLSKIESLFSDSEFGMQENRDVLLDKRNEDWVSKLQEVLPKKAVFVAVGAGHLVGEKGLIALLRKKGYVLRPLLNQ